MQWTWPCLMLMVVGSRANSGRFAGYGIANCTSYLVNRNVSFSVHNGLDMNGIPVI